MCEHSNTLVQQAMMVSREAAARRVGGCFSPSWHMLCPLSPRQTFPVVASCGVSFLLPLIQVSEELIRVAILWHEMWHEGLEEASRLYFGERNVKGMFEVLEPLHAMMERGPQTLKETSFNQVWDQRVTGQYPHRLRLLSLYLSTVLKSGTQ